MPDERNLTSISDTALWVAVYRAMETERPDALFRDPYARRLAGERGEQIVKAMPKGEQFAWPMIVRTAVMDELILDAVETKGIDTIVNLAAGLDTRPYRLQVPESLRWIDADLPDMLDYKESNLVDERPRCHLELARVDLTDVAARRALFERIGAAARQALVISEGLLVYLHPEQVRALADDLHAVPAFRWWLIDLVAPRILKMLEKNWGKQLRAGNAPFRFAPAEGTAFFEPSGWYEAVFRATGEDARRLNRAPGLMRLFSLIARLAPQKKQEELRRMGGTVLLRSDGRPSAP